MKWESSCPLLSAVAWFLWSLYFSWKLFTPPTLSDLQRAHRTPDPASAAGSVSLSVFLVSLAVTVCAVWLVALCGVCGWCQRKLGKRNKPGVETADTPDSARGRGEKKAINDLDRDFWNNNDSSTVQQRWSSYPPKEFVLNISPYAPYGDPRLTLK
uniref:Synaptotagmin 7 n=1 Tax=Amphiprion percula TaxID=161767 RepID=A0A3P8U766_AMPPE